jgi:hypothetical protein
MAADLHAVECPQQRVTLGVLLVQLDRLGERGQGGIHGRSGGESVRG